jgi:predicted transcriptional regulator
VSKVSHDVKCRDAIKILETEGYDQLPVIGENGQSTSSSSAAAGKCT